MKTDTELKLIVEAIYRDIGTANDLRYSVARLRKIEIDTLKSAVELLNSTQTDTPISDLQCKIRDLEGIA